MPQVPLVTLLLLVFAAAPLPSAVSFLMAHWTFDELSGEYAVESVTAESHFIHNNFHRPERVTGVLGRGLRFDGYSSFVDDPSGVVNQPLVGLTVEAWVAVRAYPFQTDAAIINQHSVPRGFFLGLDPLGRWNFSVGADGLWRTVQAPSLLPKFRWIHLAGVYDSASGLRLYLDGQQVASNAFGSAALSPANGSSLLIGRHNTFTSFGLFPTGIFNGLVDDVRIHNRALTGAEIQSRFASATPPAAEIVVPPERYARDLQRPIYHAIPDADWTNEPHGLIYWNGNYHLFHQRNPNGPYFGNQHWGHLISPDLIHWTQLTDALWPEPGFDQQGTWSGDTVLNGGEVVILYTSNDTGQTQSLARSAEPLLVNWQKTPGNPVIPALPPNPCAGILGFRDPFVFQHGGWHYALIGSGCPGGGGQVHIYRSANLASWEHRGILYEGTNATGAMWEMPKFFEVAPGTWCLLVNQILAGPTQGLYWLGRFENERFVPNSAAPRHFDMGRDGTQPRPMTLSPDIGFAPDGRILSFGVIIEDRFSQDQLDAGWANLFSLPRVLSLYPTGDRLRFDVPAELTGLRRDHLRLQGVGVAPGQSGFLSAVRSGAFELRAQVDMAGADGFGVVLRRSPDGAEQTRIFYSTRTGQLAVDRSLSSLADTVGKWPVTAPHPLSSGERLNLTIFVDRSVVEIIGNNRTNLATRIYPTRADSLEVDLYATGGTAQVDLLDLWTMDEASSVPVGLLSAGGGVMALRAGESRRRRAAQDVAPAVRRGRDTQQNRSERACARM